MKHVQLFEQFINEEIKQLPKEFANDKTKVKASAYTQEDFEEMIPKLKKAGRVKVPTRPSSLGPVINITLKKHPIKISYMEDMSGYWRAFLQNSKGQMSPIGSVLMSLDELVDAVASL